MDFNLIYRYVMSGVLNNGYATKHFNFKAEVLDRGVPCLACYLPLVLLDHI